MTIVFLVKGKNANSEKVFHLQFNNEPPFRSYSKDGLKKALKDIELIEKTATVVNSAISVEFTDYEATPLELKDM